MTNTQQAVVSVLNTLERDVNTAHNDDALQIAKGMLKRHVVGTERLGADDHQRLSKAVDLHSKPAEFDPWSQPVGIGTVAQ